MSQNPLQKYFRQPKIYVNLPSKGVYNKPGTIDGDATNLPICGMTGMDEIILKTPDALFSGESTVKIVESCCTGIKNAWDMSNLDTDLIFTAIRVATYGNTMGVVNTCPQCQSVNDYDVDLNRVIDHFSNCQYDNRVVIDDFLITIRPLTYKQTTEFNLNNYQLQKKLAQAESIEDKVEQQKLINELWQELADVQNTLYFNSVESVETTDGIVTERAFITEWLSNCDKRIFDSIKQTIDKNRNSWQIPTFPVKCDNCETEVNLYVDLDHSNFFV